MRPANFIFASISLLAITLTGTAARAGGDVVHGEILYQGCQDCHSIAENDIGPRHKNVYGRKAGSLPDYNYSPALKQSNFTWNDQTLDKWLADPQGFVPGSKMFYHLENPKDRADVIQFLKERAL